MLQKKRILWIDLVKFLGILFILLSHIEVEIPIISQFGGMFYVPVFFVLAGYNFKIKEESKKDFMIRRAKRLLIPYFGYSAFLFVFFWMKNGWQTKSLVGIFYARNRLHTQLETPGAVLMNIANSPLWFLPALFLTEVLFKLIVDFVKNDSRSLLLSGALHVFLGICFHYFSPLLLPWSLDSAFIFEAMMTIGYLLKKRNVIEKYANNWMLWMGSSILLAVLYFVNGAINVSIGDYGEILWAGFSMAVCASVFVMIICYKVCAAVGYLEKWTVGIGCIAQSSISIMCLHMFLFMIFETGMKALHIYSENGNSMADDLWKLLIVVITIDAIAIGRLLVVEGIKRDGKD